MTYRQEMHQLAVSVSALLTDGATVPGDDVRAALVGHLAMVELLSAVHHDLAPPDGDPIAVLGRMLREQPRRLDQPLTYVLAAQAACTAGQHWRETAKAATLAEHYWRTAVPFSRPHGDAAWTEIADIAALSQAVAALDLDIADSFNRVGRWQDAAIYRSAGQSGLRVAAIEAQALAATGLLPAAADLLPDPVRTVLSVRRPDELPAALRRLSHLAATSTTISPQHVGLACRAVAEASLLAAAGFQRAGQPKAEAASRRQAAELAKAAGHTRGVAAIDPGDPRALQQAQEIHLQLVRMRELHQVPGATLAGELGAAVNSAVVGLQQTVDQQLNTGRWLIRICEKGHLDWARARGDWETPALHASLASITQSPAIAASTSCVVDRPTAVLNPALQVRRAGPRTRPHLNHYPLRRGP